MFVNCHCCFLLHVTITGSQPSACVRYPHVRSPTSPGNTSAMSPTLDPHGDPNANTTDDYTRTMSPVSQDTYYRDDNTSRSYIDDNTRSYREDRDDDPTRPYNNNTLKLDNESLIMSQQNMPTGEDYIADEQTGSVYNEHDQNATPNRTVNSQYKDNYETTFDLDGNVETKSICSAKSGGSGHENRYLLILLYNIMHIHLVEENNYTVYVICG
jgi:hypothetical protein